MAGVGNPACASSARPQLVRMSPALDRADAATRLAAVRLGLGGDGGEAADFGSRAKAFLAEVRASQLAAHREGAGGAETAAVRSRAMDILLRCLHRRARGEAAGLALVALGGYGREELCPHSDIDLLLVPMGDVAAGQAAAEAVLYPLWDLGLKVGHSVRSLAEVDGAEPSDLHFWVALLDRRAVAGPSSAMEGLDAILARREAGEEGRALARRLTDAQRARRAKAGGSAFLQEPDLKNGVGALRDLHAIRWLCRLSRRTASPAEAGLLPAADDRRLAEARSDLLRLRCELHFQSPRPTEILSLERQDTVSEALGHVGEVGDRLGALMRGYFGHADHVRRCAELVEGQVLGDPEPEGEGPEILEDGFVLRRGGVARASHPLVFDEDPLRLVRLFRLCQLHGAAPDRATSLLVRERASLLTAGIALGGPAQSLLRDLLREVGRVHPAVDGLREHGLLERLLPEFAGLHCLVQLEFYHRWTADIHTLRCLLELDEVFRAADAASAHHLEVLRGATDPALLYVTLLLHDIGKAEGIHGHAERGAALAEPILARLGYGPAERRVAEAVIRHHLVMGIYWQRHDLDDPANVARFAETVGEAEVLRHLFVHTRCDARATSPGLWTEGKDEQHNRLLRLTLGWIERGGEGPEATARLIRLRADTETLLAGEIPPAEVEAHFRLLPQGYFLHVVPSTLALHLRAVRAHMLAAVGSDPDQSLLPQVRWSEAPRGAVDCHVVTWDRAGLFARLAGAFAVAGINIVSCRAFSRSDHVAIDVFRVALPADNPEGAKARFVEALAASLVHQRKLLPDVLAEEARLLRRLPAVRRGPSQAPIVRAYESSDLGRLVVEIQAPDRLGLLFHLGRSIRDAGYALTFANVATERGYALDTFYLVREPSVEGEPETPEVLRARLLAVLSPAKA